MSSSPNQPTPGFTSSWTKVDEPVPSRRRNAATQEAYDFFAGLATDTVVLIPADQEKVAKSAARQFMAERPQFKIGFQPSKDGLKAWKIQKPQKEDSSSASASSPAGETSAPAGA